MPIGALYTPLKEKETPPVQYEPLTCRCRAILNPFWYAHGFARPSRRLTDSPSSKPNRSAVTDVDMSLLRSAKWFTSSLQGHLPRSNATGTASEQHYHRVSLGQTRTCPSHLSVRCRYLPGARQPGCFEGVSHNESQLAATICARRSHNVRHYGMNAPCLFADCTG